MHLENILVHMIEAQDVAIFKSKRDYVRNKQKLLEYICYAQNCKVLSVICSYAAFICDILLVITLMIFFIKYQKTMQAMLMAFITMNTSNSGILSAKANSISRTFAPLFMIKITEEEQIVKDLQERRLTPFTCAVPIPRLNMDCCLLLFVVCCCFFSCGCCGINALGNVVRMYPETIQGLTFYRSKI